MYDELDNITKLLYQPAPDRWAGLQPYLNHRLTPCRRRAAQVFQGEGGVSSLEEVLQGLNGFPEDTLTEALDWLTRWRWPEAVAPSTRVVQTCLRLLQNGDERVVQAARELLERLRGNRWPECFKEERWEDGYQAPETGDQMPPVLIVDLPRSEVWLNQRYVELTALQKRILFRLAERPGTYVSCEVLYWSARGDGYVYGPAGEIKGHIREIRKILGDNGDLQRYIQSKRSVGYRLAKENVQIV